jgi:hypothetical protein
MTDEHTVHGILADLADELSPEQWINLYQLDPVEGEAHLHYRGKYQVKELPQILANASLTDYALEPLDEQGNVISVQQALNNTIQ